MEDKKLSEMTEITSIPNLNNAYVYVVNESRGGNTNNKMSLSTLQREISANESGVSRIPDWEYGIKLNGRSDTPVTVTIPCDCHISYYSSNTNYIYVNGNYVGFTSGSWNGNTIIYLCQIDCSCGSQIKLAQGSILDILYIFPYLHGNTLGGDKFAFLERQTPQQITKFINDNIGEKGNKFFVEDANYESGIYGKIEGSDEWSLIDDPDDTNNYTAFGYRYQEKNTSDNLYAKIVYPSDESFYNLMKTYNNTRPNKTGGNVSTITPMLSFSTGINQSSFDVINMSVMNLDTKYT